MHLGCLRERGIASLGLRARRRLLDLRLPRFCLRSNDGRSARVDFGEQAQPSGVRRWK